ncbi:methyl-accepting chemotaxis protein [Anoxybacterium hadale]|uniref:Methyl-accepting chemotaxis protein n=2 Tax=Anoxybacterium hadale TaxID=3408580 RepID=A0ACD1AGZ2_9FIRM|nr:methyl-accepting chemotaxis protein [Clostridiales bacterium]
MISMETGDNISPDFKLNAVMILIGTVTVTIAMVLIGKTTAREISDAVSNIAGEIDQDVSQSRDLLLRLSQGNLDEALPVSDYHLFAEEFNTLIEVLKNQKDDMKHWKELASQSRFDLSADQNFPAEFERLTSDFDGLTLDLQRLTSEMECLVIDFESGRFDTRLDCTAYQSRCSVAAERINRSVDALTIPLSEAIFCIEQLGETRAILKRMLQDDFTANESGYHRGIIEEITTSIKTISEQMLNLTVVMEKFSSGDLSDLAALKAMEKRSGNHDVDFGVNQILLSAVVKMMETIQQLSEETVELTTAAAEGALTKRGNASRFSGVFEEIILGFNNTLDAMTSSSLEVSEVLKEMSEGNLNLSIKGDYKGAHAAIKNALNTTLNRQRTYLNEMIEVLSEISQGNLDIAITMEHKGNFAEMGTSLKNLIGNLNQTMQGFRTAADQVSIGSMQVSQGSQTLAQGSTEQASSIQELTASIGEIAEKSKDNARKASEVYELAKGARDGGAAGLQTMEDVLHSMKEISDSSLNISKIIKVIDDIAFQTNILALNAAVEAARAGQHGKGFAVVAEEVRNLAARSAKAAKETTELIEGSIQKVHVGTQITNEIAAVLKEIAEGAVISTEKLSIIASASKEQATGIVQINQGIEQISKVVQNNSATAEQSAAASEELSGQAELLKAMVSRFKINHGKTDGKIIGKIIDGKNLISGSNPQSSPIRQRNAFSRY